MQAERDDSTSSDQQLPLAMRIFFRRIFPLAFIVAGVFLLAYSARELMRGHASVNWPTTEGTIVSSEVRDELSPNEPGRDFFAEVSYSYDVDGVPFVGDSVAAGGRVATGPGQARTIVERYPMGATVDVYYDPVAPHVSVLEPGIKLEALVPPFIGAAFLISGLGMVFLMPKVIPK